MPTPRTISHSAELSTNQPAPGFDRNRQLNVGNIGADISPFVDLSEFHMSQPVFRPHPHAGFSAVTYMFEDSPGTFSNRWSKGDATTIEPGCLHWTQAGSGMMHEEIPIDPGTTCHGVQMFVKLAVDDELTEPAAFHLDPDDIVETTPDDGVRIRLLAGNLDGTDARIDIRHDLTFAEIHLEAGAEVTVPAPEAHNAGDGLRIRRTAVGRPRRLPTDHTHHRNRVPRRGRHPRVRPERVVKTRPRSNRSWRSCRSEQR